MRAAARRLARWLGRRGTMLSLKGLIALLYGYAQLAAPIPDTRGLRLALHLMPITGWAWAWITAGAIALVAAWLGQDRDWPGFLAVWAVSTPWALSYLASWWPLHDNPRGWVAAAIFGAFGLVCLVAVGWPEPSRGRTEGRREP
ncbi:hypothetical protein ACFYXS_01325 [Streptomyces sp. NPDC002574]|uniref:hypothetical protein n=1 Tax=Streptomyces sp. NPDC002574 TaxID=3364652 RepID=UPI0036BADB49